MPGEAVRGRRLSASSLDVLAVRPAVCRGVIDAVHLTSNDGSSSPASGLGCTVDWPIICEGEAPASLASGESCHTPVPVPGGAYGGPLPGGFPSTALASR